MIQPQPRSLTPPPQSPPGSPPFDPTLQPQEEPPALIPPISQNLSIIPDIRNIQQFIRALEGATLDDSGLDLETIDRLRNPIQSCVDIRDDKDFRLSLKIFLADTYASEKTYEATRAAIHEHSPEVGMLSHYQIKKQIADMTGIHPISSDMCPNSCMGYTGHLVGR
ncbi:hypothetical protein C8J57DRAFT_1090332 [Mycena rebaudengoi]|nr:hypothetical protein C8J57DRAFT_1090332 [Mycena rebaudengoi]